MNSTYKTCKFCYDELEIHHITHHQKLCYLNPENLEIIAEFIKSNLHNVTKLNRNAFLNLGRQHDILTSMSIMKRMNIDDWNVALYQLALYCYLHDMISFEDIEILLYHLSYGTYWSDYKYFKKQNAKSLNKEIHSHIVDINHIYINYQNLIGAVLIRSLIDCTHNHGEIKTDQYDIIDAADFLLEFPEIITSNWYTLSEDVKNHYLSLDNIDNKQLKQFLSNIST